MAIRWEAEACDIGFDPQSGAWLTRLTSSAMNNINIYYEQPYTNATDSRIVYLRALSGDPRLPPGQQICVADLKTLRICMADDAVRTHWVATSPWSGKVAYTRANGELILLDMDTLEKRILLTHWPLPANAAIWSLSPDMNHLVAARDDADYNFHLYRIDLRDRSVHHIFTHRWIHNHIQVNHVNGRQLLLQRNRGLRRNDIGQTIRQTPQEMLAARDAGAPEPLGAGATHIILDMFTGEETPLHIGEPWCAPTTGHASWVAGTGKMATPVNTMNNFYPTPDNPCPSRTHDPRHPQGNMAIIGPGDEKPRIIHAPDMCFNHASMSRCGRYFVADEFSNGAQGQVRIVIGNIHTGKVRTLVSNVRAHGGGAACSHPHPYFTASMKYVVYNADPFLVSHIHTAKLPDSFLASLD